MINLGALLLFLTGRKQTVTGTLGSDTDFTFNWETTLTKTLQKLSKSSRRDQRGPIAPSPPPPWICHRHVGKTDARM